tara:strand:- start:371 stop:553 length:183 start_codon:yes stop_codon:yes gene_type:complete
MRATEDNNTYKIERFYFKSNNRRTIKTGLSLAEARKHCNSPDTAGDGWFDGYTAEDREEE